VFEIEIKLRTRLGSMLS